MYFIFGGAVKKEEFLKKLNGFHPNIKVTFEK